MAEADFFPRRLRELRERRQMSRKTLSELCGLSKNMIARYERGETEPPAGAIVALANYFRVSTDYLLGQKENF